MPDFEDKNLVTNQSSRMSAQDKRALLFVVAFVLDILALAVGYVVALNLRDEQSLITAGYALPAVAIPVFVMIAIARELHSIDTLENRLLSIRRGLEVLGTTALVVMGLGFLFKSDGVSRLGFITTFVVAAVVLVIGKVILNWLFVRMMDGRAIAAITLLDGMTLAPDDRSEMIDLSQWDLWPDPNHPDKIDMLSRMVTGYDRVIIACRFERRAEWATFLKGHDVGGEIVLDRNMLHGAVAIGDYDGHETLVLSLGPLNLGNRLQKRAFDLVLAGSAVVVLSPLLLLIALAVRLDSAGPVIFRQRRVGQANRQFEIYKFRTMRTEVCDADGLVSTGRDDDRVTRIGGFLRRTSLDELPQLFNVVRGEMSLVGPRPHALGSRAGELLFWEASDAYWMRHALKPGLTGLAQIRGYRGATNTENHLRMRVRSDLEYLSDWSLANDVMIILKTIKVLVHRNAY